MRTLAAFVMKGRTQAVLGIVVLTILSWVISLASLLSMAAVALPTLRRGVFEGIVLIGMALMPIGLAGWMLTGNPLQTAGYSLALWIPVWLVAGLLRESGQLSLALAGGAGLALLGVGVVFAVYDDPAAVWAAELQRFFRPILEQAPSQAEAERFEQSLAGFSRYLVGMIAAGSMLTVSMGLLIARWWQAMLFNPGGFRAEFQSLRIPVSVAYLGLGLVVATGLASGGISELAANLTIPLSILFLLAGFAVLHGVFSGKRNAGFWLAGLYVSLMFLLPLVLVIMLIGFSDTWVDWRQRFADA